MLNGPNSLAMVNHQASILLFSFELRVCCVAESGLIFSMTNRPRPRQGRAVPGRLLLDLFAREFWPPALPRPALTGPLLHALADDSRPYHAADCPFR